MQFKYPELLWALLLLLIPIIIHLFQLRRYRKTPFTNVRLLQRVVAQTRKSQSLKKWLLLISRLLLFASLVIAFAQPFRAAKSALDKKEVVIFLDDSFSMQARTENGPLLQLAVQDLIKGLDQGTQISLFTNDLSYATVSPEDIQNDLLSLPYTYKQLKMKEVFFKAHSLFSNEDDVRKELIAISDFQESMYNISDSITDFDVHLVQLLPDPIVNISIDSVFISNSTPTQLELKALLSSTGNSENTPVSIWNADTLIAKTAAKFGNDSQAEVIFSIPQDVVINGKVQITDTGLSYDNQIYFNIDQKNKIKVLIIGQESADYLERILQNAEFNTETYGLSNLNYSDIDKQNLIVLNQLPSIPNSLNNALESFSSSGGSLVIIPPGDADLESYNTSLSKYFTSSFTDIVPLQQQITSISFNHPLYKNVFESTVQNFQYPMVSTYYTTRTTAPVILRFQNGAPFLLGDRGIYIFTAPIDSENSNFTNSPLVVPTFYNMGAFSLKLPALYHPLSTNTEVDIPVTLPTDQIVKVTKRDYEFIPLQQSYSNKTTLDFEEHPSEDGLFNIVLNDSLINRISFNYPREESRLNYADLGGAIVSSKNSNIAGFLDDMEKSNRIKELWQWFAILALLFVLAEVLVQKFIK